MDRVRKWGVNCDVKCSLCKNEDESIQHLFFSCTYAAGIWSQICRLVNIANAGVSHQEVISRMCTHARKKKGKLNVMLFTECVYAIWRQRNSQIFTGHCKDVTVVFRDIVFTVASRCKDIERSELML